MQLTSDEIKILQICRSKFKTKLLSPGILRNLVQSFDSTDDLFEYIENFFNKHNSTIISQSEVEKEVKLANKIGAKIITYKSKLYPKLLKLIPDYPLVLTYLGNIELVNQKSIAIVGSRNASIAGMTFATKIARELSKYDYTVVSGLAIGIDAAAHKAAIPNTVAVMPGGVDYIYPDENKEIYKKISQEGLIISENKIGHNPSVVDFRARNRIIAGTTFGTCVIEASNLSGSLVTAKFALDYNRDVFAVPGQPLDPRSSGTNKLILDGAHMLLSVEDIIKNLDNVHDLLNKTQHIILRENSEKIDLSQINYKSYELVLNTLSLNPIEIEMIYAYTGLELRILHLILLELELINKIKRHHGNKFSLCDDVENNIAY